MIARVPTTMSSSGRDIEMDREKPMCKRMPLSRTVHVIDCVRQYRGVAALDLDLRQAR
jgi:hypothetical protein